MTISDRHSPTDSPVTEWIATISVPVRPDVDVHEIAQFAVAVTIHSRDPPVRAGNDRH